MARSLADRGVAEIELESVGFPSVFHGHDTTFAHDKRQVLTSPREEWLFSQCFCRACWERARDAGVDVERAREIVREVIEDSFADPHADPVPLAGLVRDHPALSELFAFREAVIAALLGAMRDAADGTPLTAYPMDGFGVEPGEGWPAGVTLDVLAEQVDRVPAICYVSDPTVDADRIRRLRRSIDLPIDAAITLDPSPIEREGQLHVLVNAVRAETDGRITVYHHALATEAQLGWIERAFAAG